MSPHTIFEFKPLHRLPPLPERPQAPSDRVRQLQLELAAARAEVDRLRASQDRVREDAGRNVARDIAHDLSDLLTPIAMSAALLDELVVDPDARRLLRVMQDSARRGSTIVSQLVMYARGADERPVTDPRRLLEDVRRLIAEAFPRSIEVVIEVASDVPAIDGDPAQLQEAVVKCCLDARRAMPGGGCVTLRAETVAPGDDGPATGGDGTERLVAISVSHTGNGIPERVRSLYHARVAPVDDGAVADTAPLPRGRDELILVVHDARSVRSITAQLLEAYGYRAIAAADGAEAVTEFVRRRADISAVVMDAARPSLEGGCTVQALRTIDAAVKVIAVAGVHAAAPHDGLAVAAVLPRPFRAEQLLGVLRRALGD